MESPLTLSKSILDELEEAVISSEPVLETHKGKLFLIKTSPVGAIKLNVPVASYLNFITSLGGKTPPFKSLIPVSGQSFEFVLFGNFEFDGTKLLIDGKEVSVL